ncbi:MAG: bifunctional aldolase/short-chain dehydrogenase [Deltaproteobacteria bacterium]|nr:bifunctional aldolase/short-chain dehydrogenase [Deltaproteobacteria bacterium]
MTPSKHSYLSVENRWNAAEAKDAVIKYAAQGEDLALRVYSARLIGGDPGLVLHGGGNASVKTTRPDVTGDPVEVLCVKGSGWDMGTIEPPGFPAVRLAPLLKMRQLKSLSDAAMVNALRGNLLDSSAPNPSVEALVHAFLPYKFVDHTHADAVVALVDQPDPQALCKEVFGGKLAVLPFVFPGFPLAGQVMDLLDKHPGVEGVVLVNHGLFTFGTTAEESYQRHIQYVNMAAARLEDATRKTKAKPEFTPRKGLPQPPAGDTPQGRGKLAQLMPLLRGALASETPHTQGGWQRWILHHRQGEDLLAFANGQGLEDYARRGVATPDHVIRTKNRPLVLPPLPEGDDLGEWAGQVRQAVRNYREEYDRYFLAHQGRSPGLKILDPNPRVIWVPGAGLFTAAASLKEARISADLAEHTVAIIRSAEALGRYTPLNEAEIFDMEYWSLEQAKLGKGKEAPLARQVVIVTGAGSGIGLATALAFARQGAHLVIGDLFEDRLVEAQRIIEQAGGQVVSVAGDISRPDVQTALVETAALTYGGLDILVSNAGRVWQGAMADVDDQTLRESFEVNFFSHQGMAAHAVHLMLSQGTGGHLLFNASKSAFNPGPQLGPYTLPKAAVVALMKQYALDYGGDSIRSNAINADRINTRLFGDGVLETRSKARGLSVSDYLAGNLLKQEVLASDVADGFVHLALSEKTTGTVLPVDGGNIAASPR